MPARDPYVLHDDNQWMIFTDGAAEPNPGFGGWAFVVYGRDQVEHLARRGWHREATNNQMELTALLRALEWLSGAGNRRFTTIWSDSQYVVNGATKWSPGWVKKGWRTGNGKPLLNVELWKPIHEYMHGAQRLPVRLGWCRGHSGIPGNERADELSTRGVDDARIGHTETRG